MSSFFESVFEFLFKYRPLVFEKGRLAFTTPWPVFVVFLALALVVLFALISYGRARSGNRRDIVIFSSLRVGALALLLFSLSRPALLVPTVVPQRNFLGILIDDSRSMGISDQDERPRSDFVYQTFGSADSVLYAALAERFMLRFYGFSGRAERIDGVSDLRFAGGRTDLSAALDRARRDLAAVPVAGLVVLTDGADNSDASLTESLLALNANSIPVYTVGLGRERYDRDIEINRVETPRTVLLGSSLVVDLTVRQRGYKGETVQVTVEEGARIIAAQDVRLPADGESAVVRVHFDAEEPGPRIYRFSIAPQPGEHVTKNNSQEVLIVVEDRREKILYFEGEPRFELKFIRRAVSDDENLQVVSLQRTAENKFYRLDVDDAEELAGGFPRTREELFRYRGLILGSVEASFFTHDQLRMIEEFVGQRGGGVLFLGGRRSFAEGGYDGTPVAAVMPVVLESPEAMGGRGGRGGESFFAELKVEPTRFGLNHPATQIGATAEESGHLWAELPRVSSVNPIYEVKPGASTLLSGTAEGSTDEHIVLAYQRYGRGKALALPIQDSWIWQMHADVPLDDMTHETLWRQLLRWLVAYVPDPVVAEAASDLANPGEPVPLTAEVQDETYLKVNNAEVVAHVSGPTGETYDLPMEWALEEDGEYQASVTGDAEGLYEIRVEAHKEGEFLGEHTTYFQATELTTEYFDSEMRSELLKRIADETGGRFYTAQTVRSLPEDVSFTESGTTVIEERDLWDMPIILLLVLALIATEWGYRRYRGLV